MLLLIAAGPNLINIWCLYDSYQTRNLPFIRLTTGFQSHHFCVVVQSLACSLSNPTAWVRISLSLKRFSVWISRKVWKINLQKNLASENFVTFSPSTIFCSQTFWSNFLALKILTWGFYSDKRKNIKLKRWRERKKWRHKTHGPEKSLINVSIFQWTIRAGADVIKLFRIPTRVATLYWNKALRLAVPSSVTR